MPPSNQNHLNIFNNENQLPSSTSTSNNNISTPFRLNSLSQRFSSSYSPSITPLNWRRADRWRNISPRGYQLNPISSPSLIRKTVNQVTRYSRQVWKGPEGKRRGMGLGIARTAGNSKSILNSVSRSNDRYISNRSPSQSGRQPLSGHSTSSPISFESNISQVNAIPKGVEGSLSNPTGSNSNLDSGILSSINNNRDQKKKRVLDFSSSFNENDESFSSSKQKQSKPIPTFRERRKIPTKPEKALDAIGIVQKNHHHLLDWSYKGRISVAFKQNVYLWTSDSGKVQLCCDLTTSPSKDICRNSIATCVKWNYEGTHLSIGTDQGLILIYDTTKNELIRTLNRDLVDVNTCNHIVGSMFGPINSMDWASDGTLSVASTEGKMMEYDLRIKDPIIREWGAHVSRVETIKWREGSDLLASGGADSFLKIWDRRSPIGSPLLKMKSLKAPIKISLFYFQNQSFKALSWCPWDSSILASGGGVKDSRINIWNINSSLSSFSTSSTTSSSTTSNPIPLTSVRCESSVSSLIWSNIYRELLSTHGASLPSELSTSSVVPQQITSSIHVYSYPGSFGQLKRIHSIPNAHGGKCIESSLAPDGQHVASVGQDECLKIWKIFEKTEAFNLGTGRKTAFEMDLLR